jgi:exonuclease III
MNLVCYNLRFGGARRVHWAQVIEEFAPDIFLVQESLAPHEHLPDWSRSDLKARTTWCGIEGRAWGCAVYVRHGRLRRLRLKDFDGWLVGAEVDTAFSSALTKRKLRVFSLHAPPPKIKGLSYSRTVHAMLDVIADHCGTADIIIGGDFNIGVSKRLPSEKRQTGRADLEIQERLRAEFGLFNCWQEANPDIPLAQTLRWSNEPNYPYHCDGIFVPASWRSALKDCQVVASEHWVCLSDHNPVVASFAPKKTSRKMTSGRESVSTTEGKIA